MLLITFFCLFRGIYYILTPSGDMGKAPIPIFYLLSEFPIYIFMTLFSVMIFFWADLVHFWNITGKQQVMARLKYPLIFTNVALYIIFISIIIAFSRIDATEQKKLRLAYILIVACVSLFLIGAVAIYGGIIWWTSLRSIAMKRGRRRRVIKFTSIVGVSMISLIFQVAYLLANAFDSIQDITVALTYSFVAELFPCAVLLFIFTPLLSKPSRSSTSSTGSGSNKESRNSNLNETSTTNLNMSESSIELRGSSSRYY